MRRSTGYNPRQRIATAYRVVLTVVEAFLLGETLSFAALRAIFVRRFGFVRSCPLQKRFQQESAVAFFRAALERLVSSVVEAAGIELRGPLARFTDVRVYDGTAQRVPPRGRGALPACAKGRAGAKWLAGYSIKTGLLEEAVCGAERFFERRLFSDAIDAGAHVLMCLKTAKVRVVASVSNGVASPLPNWSLSYYLTSVSRRRERSSISMCFGAAAKTWWR